MLLEYVEKLMELMIVRGYIQEPRSLLCHAELNERAELLVMMALFLLGNGATFRKCALSPTFLHPRSVHFSLNSLVQCMTCGMSTSS